MQNMITVFALELRMDITRAALFVLKSFSPQLTWLEPEDDSSIVIV